MRNSDSSICSSPWAGGNIGALPASAKRCRRSAASSLSESAIAASTSADAREERDFLAPQPRRPPPEAARQIHRSGRQPLPARTQEGAEFLAAGSGCKLIHISQHSSMGTGITPILFAERDCRQPGSDNQGDSKWLLNMR